MLGFLLNDRSGRFLRLTPKETDALHEILTWGRQPGSNRILEFFGTTYEAFHGACGKIMERFRDVLPEGSRRARIRMTRRESHQPTEGTFDETLGEEACGMVGERTASQKHRMTTYSTRSGARTFKKAPHTSWRKPG